MSGSHVINELLAVFNEEFPDEATFRGYLAWYVGDHWALCGHLGPQWKTKRGLRICQTCGRQGSITAGTVFRGTHLQLHTWFQAIWLLCAAWPPPTPRAFQQAVRLPSYSTARDMFSKLLGLLDPPGEALLEGEVDVTRFGFDAWDAWNVMLGVERLPRPRVRFQWTEEAPLATHLVAFADAWIATDNSKIFCDVDGWAEVRGATHATTQFADKFARTVDKTRHPGVATLNWWRLCVPVLGFRLEMDQKPTWELLDEMLGRATHPKC